MTTKKIRIALDAMGGDNFPWVLVKGGLAALREYPDIEVTLVGDETVVGDSLKHIIDLESGNKSGSDGMKSITDRLKIVHASEMIGMDESPARTIRTKKKSSIVIANKLCKSGDVEAVISAGNTGAAMGSSLLYMGRLKGVHRPAIMALFPSKKNYVAILDVGANTDCKPEHLYQFGVMGSIYISHVLGYKSPRVGLLSIGEEKTKGNEITTDAYELLEQSDLNFVGNVEGRDIFKGDTDVIICDGFVGNILLKFGESVFGFVTHTLKKNIQSSVMLKASAYMLRPAFSKVKEEMTAEEYGGAPLLGVDGISIICHGNSSPMAIKNAIKVARQLVQEKMNEQIKNEIEQKAV